jgi:hypothetical protein
VISSHSSLHTRKSSTVGTRRLMFAIGSLVQKIGRSLTAAIESLLLQVSGGTTQTQARDGDFIMI